MSKIIQEIRTIFQQRASAMEELSRIRQLIRADPNESTYDEVVRLLCPGAGRGRLKDGVPEHPRDSTDEDVERVYNEFWLPIITEAMADGEHVGLMPMAVKRELYDYSILLEHVPKVYMYATGGRVSKPNTVAAAVIGEYENALTEACDQAVEDFKEEQGLGKTKELAVEWLTASALLKDLGSLIPVQFQEAHKAFDILEPICKRVDETRGQMRSRVVEVDYEIADEPAKGVFGYVDTPMGMVAVYFGEDEQEITKKAFEECKKSFDIGGATLWMWERTKGKCLLPPRVVKTKSDAPPGFHTCAHEWEDSSIPCPDGKPGCLVLHTERRCKKCGAKPGDDHAGPQPPPGAGREDVLDALLQDYKTRAEFGEIKYGTRLKTFNGRRALVDALQEAMDLAIYLKQVLMEEDASKAGAAS